MTNEQIIQKLQAQISELQELVKALQADNKVETQKPTAELTIKEAFNNVVIDYEVPRLGEIKARALNSLIRRRIASLAELNGKTFEDLLDIPSVGITVASFITVVCELYGINIIYESTIPSKAHSKRAEYIRLYRQSICLVKAN